MVKGPNDSNDLGGVSQHGARYHEGSVLARKGDLGWLGL